MNLDKFLAGVLEADRDHVREAVNVSLTRLTDYRCEYRGHHPTRGLRWFAGRGRLICDSQGQSQRFLGITLDITEQKQAQEALQESESRLRLALGGAQGGAWECDLASGRVWWSPEMFTLWGKEAAHPMDFDMFVAGVIEEDRARVKTAVQEAVTNRSDYHCEFRGYHPTRGLRWFSSRGQVIYDLQGQPQRLIGISQDITERKRAEQLMRDSETRLQAVIHGAAAVAIQWFDDEGRVVLWNEASEKMYGFSAQQAIGRTLDELMLTQEEAAEFLKTLLEVEQTERPHYPQEYAFRRSTGEMGVCLSSISCIPGVDGGHWFVCMDVDITSQKRAEERARSREGELAHALRLATMGEMAAQISHEINQPLYAIGNYAQASLNELSKPEGDREEVLEWLQRIHRASSRTSEVLGRIAGFVRRGDRKPQATSLNQLIEGALELLSWKTARQQIEIRFEPLQPDIALKVDAIQIEQVLLNLLLNACEAVAGNGTPQGRVTITTEQRAGEIQIDIVDNGPGLAEEVRDSLFQAFVTTKTGGLGLGLAISRSIVEAHGGTIAILPNPTQGVTVQLVLPSIWKEVRI